MQTNEVYEQFVQVLVNMSAEDLRTLVKVIMLILASKNEQN